MAGERAPLPAGGSGLLGARTRSYGSLVRSPVAPGRQRRIEHKLQPGETLQGLALKYGVSMEQIKRANRMYTNDSIFLKTSLSIPVPLDLDHCSNGVDSALGGGEDESGAAKQDDGKDRASDLAPLDFLKRLDVLISHSKQAAVRGRRDAEERVAALEAACINGTSDRRPLTRSQSVASPSRMQQAPRGAAPPAVAKLAKKLRDGEDEIFQL